MDSKKRDFLNRSFPEGQWAKLGDEIVKAGGIDRPDDSVYYVRTDGNDSNDGQSWETAFKTIQHACNIARYLPGTTTIDDSTVRDKWIYVFPIFVGVLYDCYFYNSH